MARPTARRSEATSTWLALDRLELRDDGRVTYRFKKAWRDGTHAVVLSPADFIARLCALVPRPRVHLMRYLGVLAGHSSLRAEVVPKKLAAPPKQLPLLDERDEPTTSAKSAVNKTAEPSRHPWPWLLQRVFADHRAESARRASEASRARRAR